MKKLYIAYGSNINLDQMALRCPNSEPMATALLKGYELQFKYHATIAPNPDGKVPILLWGLSKSDEKRLDRYEGYPKYYRKEIEPIDYFGEAGEGMVYVMNGDKPLQAPSEQYYQTILQGYKAVGLDTSYLEAALAKAQEFRVDEDFQMRF